MINYLNCRVFKTDTEVRRLICNTCVNDDVILVLHTVQIKTHNMFIIQLPLCLHFRGCLQGEHGLVLASSLMVFLPPFVPD